jgi:hypothetical protein
MYLLKETTNWGDNTPNHTYIMEKKGASKIIGYIKQGQNEPHFFDKPLTFTKSRRTFKEQKV